MSVKQKRAHYLQHVPFEGLGSIDPWLEKKKYHITSTKFYEAAILPKVEEIDFLIIMGGPMSVMDEEKYPWLRMEKNIIGEAVEKGKAVLGICLGAQLIANVLGSTVYPNRRKEIGWFPIQAVDNESPTAFSFPASLEVFHWHGETFDLPEKATHLARSEACTNQAFQIGRKVIGLQFHLETTPESAAAIVKHCKAEILPSEFVQSDETILAVSPEQYRNVNKMMAKILDYLHSRI